MSREPLSVRFWRKVEKAEDGHWYWRGFASKGYGVIRIDSTTIKRVHVLSYELYWGPVPDGKEVDHVCRVTLCVNPEHLEAVTHGENIRRGLRGRLHEKPSHCANGHALTKNNMAIHKDAANEGNGYRWRCKTCQRESMQRYRAEHPELATVVRPLPPLPSHCIHGHVMEGDNVTTTRWGWACRQCARDRANKSHARKLARQRKE